MQTYFTDDETIYEIGTDEVGRGPLFGRVYTASVILPKSNVFDHHRMKDSKQFHSKSKITEVAQYIKENAIAWSVQYEDEKTIDEINILQATQKAMHKSILDTRQQILKSCKTIKERKGLKFNLLIDGNYFNPVTIIEENRITSLPHICVKGGDNKFTSIAAASILAKVERDKYIEELCEKYPELKEFYSIHSNKGYGAKVHIEGILKHGISPWHRKTFGICKKYS